MIWSGIGFNLLITALCLELYPLINDFWTRTKIQNGNSPLINFGEFNNRFYQLYLANRDTNTGATTATTAAYYGNCMTNALKCALSVAVAFSAILGRAGHLECFFVVIFGTVGFELNRQIIQSHQGQDAFGTYYIFTFGGFMGLVLGLFSWVREKRVEGKENL
jgi:hypothetical protein